MNYEQAKAYADAGKAVWYSNAGGWKRWMRFTDTPFGVDVYIYGRRIARFTPQGVTITGAGYIHKITTREAINTLLPHGCVGSDKNIIWYAPPGSYTWSAKEGEGKRIKWEDNTFFSYEKQGEQVTMEQNKGHNDFTGDEDG